MAGFDLTWMTKCSHSHVAEHGIPRLVVMEKFPRLKPLQLCSAQVGVCLPNKRLGKEKPAERVGWPYPARMAGHLSVQIKLTPLSVNV